MKVGHLCEKCCATSAWEWCWRSHRADEGQVETGGHVEVNKQSWRFEIGAPCAATVAWRMCA